MDSKEQRTRPLQNAIDEQAILKKSFKETIDRRHLLGKKEKSKGNVEKNRTISTNTRKIARTCHLIHIHR
jgi:hypothetical protein